MAGLLIFAASGAFSAEQGSGVVKAKILLASGAAPPGSIIKLTVLAQVTPGFHINDHHPSLDYLIPTQVTFENLAGLKTGRVFYPKGRLRKFPFLNSPISVYEGEVRIAAEIAVAPSLHPGTYELHGKLSYQACNNHACLPPANVPLQATIRVVQESVPTKPQHSEVFRQIPLN